MLRFLQIPVALSAAIASLSLLPTVAVAQSYPLCYMINSAGEVIDLTNLCQPQAKIQKAKSCAGPVDKDGFPIALIQELRTFEAILKNAKQRNYKIDEYAEIAKLLASVSLPPESENARRKFVALSEILKNSPPPIDSPADKSLQEQYNSAYHELEGDPCFGQVTAALSSKKLL
jgi:hypothetical protein